MARFASLAAGALILVVAGCGGDDPSGPNSNTLPNGTAGATVSGTTFSPYGASFVWNGTIFSLAIVDISGRAVSFAVFASAPGTYQISTSAGNNAQLLEPGGASWNATNAGAGVIAGSGTVVLTVLSQNRAAGTFSFVLEPVPESGATGTRTISSGTFDLVAGQ
jgi:hypothetical protein